MEYVVWQQSLKQDFIKLSLCFSSSAPLKPSNIIKIIYSDDDVLIK